MREDVSNTVCGLGRFLRFDTTWRQYARLAIFSYLLFNTYVMNSNSKCIFVGAPHRYYTDFRKVTGHYSKELCGQNEFLNIRAREVHTTYCFCDLF